MTQPINRLKKPSDYRFLSSGNSVPSSVAAMSIASVAISSLSLLLLIANYGATHRVAQKEVPTLVQLADGSTITVAPLGKNDRTPEVIKKFVSDTFVLLFNWDGVLPSSLSESNSDQATPALDSGVVIKGGNKSNQSGRVTTGAWHAAFSITDEGNFRQEFLRELAQLTPEGVFKNGQVRVALIPRHVSEPQKIGEGRWQVDLVATLVTFERGDNSGKGVPFNKTVFLRAVDTPQMPPPEATELARTIYRMRSSGLEITGIVDLERKDLK